MKIHLLRVFVYSQYIIFPGVVISRNGPLNSIFNKCPLFANSSGDTSTNEKVN